MQHLVNEGKIKVCSGILTQSAPSFQGEHGLNGLTGQEGPEVDDNFVISSYLVYGLFTKNLLNFTFRVNQVTRERRYVIYMNGNETFLSLFR